MKTLSKICIASLTCLTACYASAETSPSFLYGAPVDLFFVGIDPSSNLSMQAVENCRIGGGLAIFEKAGLFMEENANTIIGINSTDLVFDPTVNHPVPRFYISKNSQMQFFKLTEKLDHFSILGDVMLNNGSLKAVTTAIKDEYSVRGIRYEYSPGIVYTFDPTYKGLNTLLAIYKLHNKIILATEKKQTCSPEFVESAWVEAKVEVASLENCTVKFNSAVPFAAKATDLTCDGHKFVILGASE